MIFEKPEKLIDNFSAKLNEYAQVLVNIGLQIKKGDTVIIESPVDCAVFARICTEKAYLSGAKEVIVYWNDDFVTRQKFLRADDDVFDSVPEFITHLRNDYALAKASFLFIDSSDPNLLSGVENGRILRNAKARCKAFKPFITCESNNEMPWCIAAVPEIQWAKTVFPNLEEASAIAKLWEAIFEAVRINGDEKAVARWKNHTATLQKRAELLNRYHFKSLHYKNSLGTDLQIELPDEHIWSTGESVCEGKGNFVANIPTEEVFTSPQKYGVNGIVFASKPLSHSGNLIKDFYFKVEKGKITEAHAKEGEKILSDALSVDEGASYFGEVALIPFDSPISNQNILYFNTLFDENASCHFAFGNSFPECFKDGTKMTDEELMQKGLNISDTHVDFMVGTPDLEISGTTKDGEIIPVFKNGNFAF